jgi:hypothetical protein
MGDIVRVIINGWPEQKEQLPMVLTPFWTFRDDISVFEGIVYKGQQVVIPTALRKLMMKKIHVAHLGAESTIRMCKDIIFWPGMKAEIKDM